MVAGRDEDICDNVECVKYTIERKLLLHELVNLFFALFRQFLKMSFKNI